MIYTKEQIFGDFAFKDFEYWFKFKKVNEYIVYDSAKIQIGCIYCLDGKVIYDSDSDTSDQYLPSILKNFEDFKNRPEYAVYTAGKYIEDDSVYSYQKLLVGCALIKCFTNTKQDPDDVVWDRIQPALKWLDSTDFYTCPASTVYHDAYPGGLLRHSLNVVENILAIHNLDKFLSIPIESAIMVALVHDWCKIGTYIEYDKNVKDEETGKWVKQRAYKKKDSPISAGHGVSSCYLASRVFNLNHQEFLAIRWHMGVFNVADNEIDELQYANETYPLVLLLQWSDHLSCVKY